MNNAQANNLQTTPTISGYPCVLGVGSCSLIAYPSNPTGCLATLDNCNISKISTISFLNANSPFTQLIDGNFLGFFTSLFPTSFVHYNPYPQYPLNSNVQGIKLQCTPIPTTQTVILNPVSPYNVGCEMQGNATITSSPLCEGIYFTIQAPFANATNFGYSGSLSSATMAALNFPTQAGYLILQNVTFKAQGVLGCAGATPVYNYTAFVSGATQTTSTNALSSLSFIGFIIGGVILLILAIGIGFGGSFLASGANLSTNDQGTKQAAVVGVGILVWSFITNEFAVWMNALPLNLGSITILSLTTIFFFGIYWRMFSLD